MTAGRKDDSAIMKENKRRACGHLAASTSIIFFVNAFLSATAYCAPDQKHNNRTHYREQQTGRSEIFVALWLPMKQVSDAAANERADNAKHCGHQTTHWIATRH